MRFKTGIVIGFAAGYYLGAKAGRERYHQLQDLVAQAKDSSLVQKAVHHAKDLADDAKGMAKDAIDTRIAAATPTPPGTRDDTDQHSLFRDPTLN